MSALLEQTTTTPRQRWTWSRDQYYELDRMGYFQNSRVERLRGEIYTMSPINWPHIVACRKTAALLEDLFAKIAWVNRCEQPLALSDSDPQPDIVVVPGKFEDYTDHPTTALLIVEVASTTLERDTGIKAEIYAEAQIPEYWVLDIENRKLYVYRNPTLDDNQTYVYPSPQILRESASISPLAMPDSKINIRNMLP